MWDNGTTTADVTGLCAGLHFVTVTDAHLCTTSGSFFVDEPAFVEVTGTPVDTKCYLSCDGSISTLATGGTGPYTYSWTGPGTYTATTANISGLCAGTYFVTVTDSHSCDAIGNWTIGSPAQLTVTGVVADAMCHSSADGSITITPAGGTAPYTYVWSNGPTTQNISGLTAGSYAVTVTDAHLCTATGSWTVNQPDQILWTGSKVDVTCHGFNDGIITTLTTTGGTGTYHYSWSNGGTTANLSGLAPGTYTLTITDDHGCFGYGSMDITQPDALAIDANATVVMPSCHNGCDGTISDIVVTGGTLPYAYMWDNGTTTANVAGLCSGVHYVTVTDAHLCSTVGSFNVGNPTAVEVVGTPVDTKCWLSCDGEISTVATGGTGSYSYSWTGPNGFTSALANLTGLCAGTYNLTVTDTHNCTTTGSWIIGSPVELTVTGTATDALCKSTFSGTVSITPAGGTSPYTYLWSNGETTQNISGLLADTYTVTVTDAHLCTVSDSWVVNEPGEVSWTGDTQNISCNGANDGKITTLTTLGGTAPYTYYWSGPGGFSATTANLTNLAPGWYYLTVTDAHSCDARSQREITQPDVLAISPNATITAPICYTACDGTISNVSVTGGTSPYTYLWSNTATTANISGLCAGFYSLTVTDAHGCVATQQFEVPEAPWWSFEINGPAQACCSSSNINTTATYTASALTGTWSAPVTYQWTVEGGQILSGQNSNEIVVRWSCCGTGKVYLTVHQGPVPCSLTKELPVTITPTPAPVISGPVSITANDISQYCVVGGDPTHLYTWTVVGGVVTGGQGSACITVAWGDYPPCGCGQVTVCESTQITPGVPGCTGCATLNITILPNTAGINLSGTVSYKNAFGTALNGVTIKLRNLATNTIVATTVTGPNMNPPNYTGDPGYYSFMNVAAGSYKLEATFNGAWGGNNATDALLIQIEAGTPGYLLANYGQLNLGAADVNGSAVPPSSGVTALDALYVKLRTVGSISSYPAGDWRFDNPTVTIPVAGQVNFNGLCYGDVNGSYIPTGLKELSFLSSVEDATQIVPVEENFTYAIRSNMNAKLGAMTLFMGYDAERFDVVDIASQNDEMKYVIENGNVAIAWADTKPMSVKNDDQLFTLTVKAKVPVTEATQVFNVRTGSEFADALGTRYDNFELKMSKVITPNGSNEFSIFNYPNPFNVETKIAYTLPESGNVKLVITDMYGKTVRTMVDETQAIGLHTVNVNASELNLAAGVYLYRIEVTGATQNYVKVNKLIFAR